MKLANSLNRTVLVAIPAFFGDDRVRRCTLVEADTAGLWLACDELKERLAPAHEVSTSWAGPVTAFFPFTQVLYVVDLSQFALLGGKAHRPPPPSPAAPPSSHDAHPEHAHRNGRQKPKQSRR